MNKTAKKVVATILTTVMTVGAATVVSADDLSITLSHQPYSHALPSYIGEQRPDRLFFRKFLSGAVLQLSKKHTVFTKREDIQQDCLAQQTEMFTTGVRSLAVTLLRQSTTPGTNV